MLGAKTDRALVGRRNRRASKGPLRFIKWMLLAVVLFIALFWSMEDIMLYYELILSDTEPNKVSSDFVEVKNTATAQEGIVGMSDPKNGVTVPGEYDADSIGYFGAFWFWLEFETGATDISAFACVTLDDSLGGQAYGIQFDLKQGSLESFMIYCVEQDPQKYAVFNQFIGKPWTENYATSMSSPLPVAWKTLFNADLEGFAAIQKQYVYDNYWPTVEKYLQKTDIDYKSRPQVVQGALMSYGHQHGANSGSGMTWAKTFAGAGITNATSDEDFLIKLYTFRKNRKPRYASRYDRELEVALDLLAQEKALMASAGSSTINPEGGAENATLGGNILWPVPSATYVNSHFGYRSVSVGSSSHRGIDIPEDSGMPIVAVADGTVAKSEMQSGYGNVVFINHDGFATVYAHMSKRLVKAGDKIKAGQQIGLVGSTGQSSGNHLHFEIRIPDADGDRHNPLYYYQHISYTIADKYYCCARGQQIQDALHNGRYK